MLELASEVSNIFSCISTRVKPSKCHQRTMKWLQSVIFETTTLRYVFFYEFDHFQLIICMQVLFAMVEDMPDMYLEELCVQLQSHSGIQVSTSMIWRALTRGGYTMKKVSHRGTLQSVDSQFPQLSRVAIKRSKELRDEYLLRIGNYEPEQLVFVDKSSIVLTDVLPIAGVRGLSEGHWLNGKLFLCRDDGNSYMVYITCHSVTDISFRFSVLPALSLLDGIIHCDIVEGSFDTNAFYDFISKLLDPMEPYPAKNSVIVIDNCCIHKHPAILDLIEEW